MYHHHQFKFKRIELKHWHTHQNIKLEKSCNSIINWIAKKIGSTIIDLLIWFDLIMSETIIEDGYPYDWWTCIHHHHHHDYQFHGVNLNHQINELKQNVSAMNDHESIHCVADIDISLWILRLENVIKCQYLQEVTETIFFCSFLMITFINEKQKKNKQPRSATQCWKWIFIANSNQTTTATKQQPKEKFVCTEILHFTLLLLLLLMQVLNVLIFDI